MDYKLIPLTRGQFAIVDAADFEWLNQWRWNAWKPSNWTDSRNNYYAKRHVKLDDGSSILLGMHNLILDTPNGMVGDHWNGDTLDNRRCNLRVVTRSQNCKNTHASKERLGAPERIVYEPPTEFERPLSSRNSTGFEQVFSHKGRWGARITIKGKPYYLGIYDTKEEAAQVYEDAKAELERNPRYRPKRKPSSRNSSGMIGVSHHKASGKWRVTTTVTLADGTKKHKHIGLFTNKREAIAARKQQVGGG